jgi:hypothetical protein
LVYHCLSAMNMSHVYSTCLDLFSFFKLDIVRNGGLGIFIFLMVFTFVFPDLWDFIPIVCFKHAFTISIIQFLKLLLIKNKISFGIVKILRYIRSDMYICTLRLQQTRSYYILPKAPTRSTLSYTCHTMKQSNLIKREQTGIRKMTLNEIKHIHLLFL